MLKISQLNVYDLFYVGATFSIVMSYMSTRVDVLPDLLLDPFF